jgi:hypothetical protein
MRAAAPCVWNVTEKVPRLLGRGAAGGEDKEKTRAEKDST